MAEQRVTTLSGSVLGRVSETIRWVEGRKTNFPADKKPLTKFGTRLVRIARTTTNADYPTYPPPPANTFVVEFGTTEFTETPGLQTLTFTPYDPAETRIAHDPRDVYHAENTLVMVMLNHDQWFIWTALSNLVELCAQETASRNVPYECLLGTWDPDLGIWCYDDAPTVYAIDHRKGTPYAELGWKGLYQKMPSTDVDHDGYLYVCVSLDCELPEEGCNECEEA